MSSKRKNKKPKLVYTLHLSSKYSNINFLEPMHGRAYETVKAKIAGETTWVESKTGGLPYSSSKNGMSVVWSSTFGLMGTR